MNNQCVPSLDLDNDGPPFAPPTQPLLLHHNNRLPYAAEYEVAELTWKDGNLALLGLRHPPRIGKPIPRYPSPAVDAAGGTLECIVDQARGASSSPDPLSWVGGVRHPAFVDALVPCANQGSGRKRTRDGGRDCASQGSTTPKKLVALAASVGNGAGTLVKADACEQSEAKGADKNGYSTTPSASRPSAEDHVEGGASPETENESFAGTRSLAVDDRDSVSHSPRYQRDALGEIGTTSISTKRSRVAAIHNMSERKRRDRINEKMKTLQKLLPNSSKTDKASMLDEVIEYLKLLQAQVHMMSRMSTISHHQLQISMMTQLARMSHMSMGLGMMDPNMLGRPGSFGMPPPSPPPPPQMLHPSAFFPLHPPSAAGAWDASGTDWIQQPGSRAFPDMFSAFMGCPTQQQAMGTETYNRMAGIYQLLYGYNQK